MQNWSKFLPQKIDTVYQFFRQLVVKNYHMTMIKVLTMTVANVYDGIDRVCWYGGSVNSALLHKMK